MNEKTAYIAAIIFGALGTLFTLAGVFAGLPFGYALLAAITCYIIASVVKRIGGNRK